MCTLAVYFRVSERVPLLVAANRDEFLDRPTAQPRVISDAPWVVGGQDLSAGGTWFGVNAHHMVVGVLNRRQSEGPDTRRRSRGLLCLEALQASSPGEAVARLRDERGTDYNGFNLLIADTAEAYVASNVGAEVRITPLSPGVHLITNLELNDPTCPRIAKSHRLFEAIDLSSGTEEETALLLDRLRTILADHSMPLDPRADRGGPNTLCVHLNGYGTRSSTIVTCCSGSRKEMRYWYAPGPPCRSPYGEISLPAAASCSN